MARLAFIGLLLLPASASAVVLEPLSLEEMVDIADAIVVGHVVSRTSRYDSPPRENRIVTDVVVVVEQTLKGEPGSFVVVTVPGGVVDGKGQMVPGGPVLKEGEEVVLFLNRTDGFSRTIVGFSQGLFLVYRDNPTGPARVRQKLGGAYFVGAGLVQEADMELEELRRFVRARQRLQERER